MVSFIHILEIGHFDLSRYRSQLRLTFFVFYLKTLNLHAHVLIPIFQEGH